MSQDDPEDILEFQPLGAGREVGRYVISFHRSSSSCSLTIATYFENGVCEKTTLVYFSLYSVTFFACPFFRFLSLLNSMIRSPLLHFIHAVAALHFHFAGRATSFALKERLSCWIAVCIQASRDEK